MSLSPPDCGNEDSGQPCGRQSSKVTTIFLQKTLADFFNNIAPFGSFPDINPQVLAVGF
jgi:hypothetical protein